MSLASARCAYHPAREASAACLDCKHFYCRECVTESAGGMYCRRCLQIRATLPATPRRSVWRWGGHAAAALGGLALLWALFAFLLSWVATQPAHYLIAGWHAH